jgi:hypothetical protein
MILGMPARRLAVPAPAIEAAWAASPSVNAIRSESNRRFEADVSGSGTYANVVCDKVLQDLGYYSVEVNVEGGEVAAVGLCYYSTDFSASNPEHWAGIAVGGFVAGESNLGFWGNTGIIYRRSIAIRALPASNSVDLQIAVRRDGSSWRVWMRTDGGNWNNISPSPGSPDPVADTGPFLVLEDGTETRLQLIATIQRSGASSARFVRLHGNASETTGAVPSGFTAALFADP